MEKSDKSRCRADAERERIEEQIEATDRAIDALVYELYGLTDEEIKTVEESS
jgi:type II restriction/modification system DNA methylase subunit YeeA